MRDFGVERAEPEGDHCRKTAHQRKKEVQTLSSFFCSLLILYIFTRDHHLQWEREKPKSQRGPSSIKSARVTT